MDSDALPPLNGALPSTVTPSNASTNVTVPVGVPEPGATALTVALKVIDWPYTAAPDELTVVLLLD